MIAIYLTDTLSIGAVKRKFLFEVKPAGEGVSHLQVRLHG